MNNPVLFCRRENEKFNYWSQNIFNGERIKWEIHNKLLFKT